MGDVRRDLRKVSFPRRHRGGLKMRETSQTKSLNPLIVKSGTAGEGRKADQIFTSLFATVPFLQENLPHSTACWGSDARIEEGTLAMYYYLVHPKGGHTYFKFSIRAEGRHFSPR